MEIKAEQINKTYNKTTILESISFSMGKGQKVGLVGDNGIGKSTLLKILAGIIQPDRGEIILRKGLVIGYMPQDADFVADKTISSYLRQVSGIAALEAELENSLESLAEYERRDGYAFDHRMKLMLAGFGLKEMNSDRVINTLSSGQKSKVFMAGVLLADPDLLLLDEPTNNLDLPALIWLEHFLTRSKASCIIVSHDCFFLDQIVGKIFEIDWQTRMLKITNGKYSDYLTQIKKEHKRQSREYDQQQEEIKRLSEVARTKRSQAVRGSYFRGSDNDKLARGFKRDRAAKSGRAAKVIEKRIEKMKIVEKPVERDVFRIHINPSKPGGSRDIMLKQVVAGYSDFHIGPLSLDISYGSRIVVLGTNGSGKSTLLKIISEELKPITGDVEVGSALIVGNLMQEHENLPRDKSLKNFLTKQGNITTQEAHALADKFRFNITEIDKKIGSLSPGERSRLLFALFSALSVNVLLLDEPTNHLDLMALDALEEVVINYEGTILLVSHDRHFLQKFEPTDTYIISNGKLVRQKSFKAYLTNAEQEAKRLIKRL
ncbi:hypothetical protein CL633_02660 [bacterium]|nr:hypothetical protein [bacterium]|tara:strand:+ start:2510 stop:4147 length:1638 start_codon:yes stop_codon:yes gene_type:complete